MSRQAKRGVPPAPRAALEQLVRGNRRFLAGRADRATRGFSRELSLRPQQPLAVVLGCSDSRKPVEILFDQSFGDLFVVRIAGNVVAPSVVGSVEFAISLFGTRLVVVLGHTRCGAIEATVTAIESGFGHESDNIRSITDRIAPYIEGIVRSSPPAERMREAMRANVRASMEQLRHGSRMLEKMVLSKRVAVVGAEYELESGRVGFFAGVPRR